MSIYDDGTYDKLTVEQKAAVDKAASAAVAAFTNPSATPASIPGSTLGYGGQTTWDTINKYSLTTVKDATADTVPVSQTRLADLSSKFDAVSGSMQSSIDKMEAVNADMLEGKIPQDVQDQVRRLTSSKAGFNGLFGPSARALTARDLGTTSLAIQQQGIQTQSTIAGLQDTLAKTTEAARQFNTEYNLRASQFAQSVRDSNLKSLALEEARLQFNAQQNLAVTGLIADLINNQQQLSYQYAYANAAPGGLVETYNNWIKELSKLLV